MASYNFKEQTEEFSAKHGKKLPVWKTPNYEAAKQKAIEIIESGKYGVKESDFWILMNATKNEKMAYTGLIISHNGCLKINDSLESKFNPDCVSLDKEGYNGSLVYSYCNSEQGIFEVGEVSSKNCKNEYPYAMAFKRLFDRVVLKLSKLAYNGIYSDSESEEFSQQLNPAEKNDGYPQGEEKNDGYPQGEEYKPYVRTPKDTKEAGALLITSGKYPGYTLKQIWKSDKAYFEELGTTGDALIKAAVLLMKKALSERNESKTDSAVQ